MSREEVVLRKGADTYATMAEPHKPHSGLTYAPLEENHANYYVRFHRGFPLGANVLRAHLYVYTAGDWDLSAELSACQVDDWLGAHSITWANRPGLVGASVQVSHHVNRVGTEFDFDVTQQMQSVSDGADWNGFAVRRLDGGDSKRIFALDSASQYTPRMEILWTSHPEAPTRLAPDGDRAVSVQKPTLGFNFRDNLGSTHMAGCTVQINSTSSFSNPDWNSGNVSTSVPELDLSDTDYPGLPSGGASRYWRVRVQDGAGQWSGWSDVAKMRYVAQPALSLTIPQPAPDNIVTDPSPTIEWSYAGTSARWRLGLQRLADSSSSPDDDVYSSGWQDGTADQWTIPTRAHLRDNHNYRVYVRVEDAVDREGVPGHPAFAYVSQAFHFDDDDTYDPPDTLTVAQVGTSPWVKVTWTRTGAPDAWIIRRDGKVIATDLDPGDVLESGSTYSWTDYGADGNTEHTYRVQALVNHKATANGPTKNITTKPTGIWLVDPERYIQVQIYGTDPGTWNASDAFSIYSPLRGNFTVKIAQSQRGAEGSVQGMLISDDTHTAHEWAHLMERIRNSPSRPVTLAFPTRTLTAALGDIVTGVTDASDRYTVSFDFWEAE
ncbi:MAG: DUF7594 domain-containing protein [Nocardioidaceae bacterium]